MGTITFDTLEYANTLKDAAVPDEQAQAQAKALRHALEVALADRTAELATKADVLRLENKIELVSKDLLIKLGGGLIGAVTIILAAIGLAARYLSH